MRRMRGFAIGVLMMCAWSAACESMTALERIAQNVEFTTDRGLYAPGDSIEARLGNRTGEQIAYNLCFTVFQRRVEGRWDEAAAFGIGICAGVAHGLDSGDAASYSAAVPVDLPGGTYRLHTNVTLLETRPPTGGLDIASTTFTIR